MTKIQFKALVALPIAAICLLGAAAPAGAQGECKEPIHHLGGSNTAIVRGGVKDVGQMAKKLADPKITQDLQQVLVEGLSVSPEMAAELYKKILAEAQRQAAENLPPMSMGGKQTEFLWMAYRKNGKVALLRDCCWKGKGPLYAWELQVEHDGIRYHFIMPKQCLNLAVHSESIERLPPPPPPKEKAVCELRATADNDAGTVALDATGSKGAVTITAVTRDGSPVGSPDLTSPTPGKWLFRSPENGSFTFSAEAKTKDESATCSAAATLVPPTISCSITATVTPERVIDVQISSTPGTEHSCPQVSYTLDNGKSGSSELTPCEASSWTYPSKGKAKSGSYSVGSSVTGPRGSSAQCTSGEVQVPRPPFPRWTARAFGARFDTSADTVSTASSVNGVSQRTKLGVGDGTGFGLGLEFRPAERFGVELGALFTSLDSNYFLDLGEDWGRSEDDLDFNAFTLGINFHPLAAGGRFDLFLGPFLGIGQYDDVELTALGRRSKVEFDNDTLWGLQVGLDYSFSEGSPWALTGGLKYIDTSADQKNGPASFDLGGVLFGAGLAYRF